MGTHAVIDLISDLVYMCSAVGFIMLYSCITFKIFLQTAPYASCP